MTTRRDALRAWNQPQEPGQTWGESAPQPPAPVDLIPGLQPKKKRKREWESHNPVQSFFIPLPLHAKAREIREAIRGLAQEKTSTISKITTALFEFALTKVEQGELKIEPRLDPTRRKTTITWEDVNTGWPQEIHAPKKRAKATHELYLGWRLSKSLGDRINALAGEFIPPGEVVVFLLDHALQAYQTGLLKLSITPAVSQKVRLEW